MIVEINSFYFLVAKQTMAWILDEYSKFHGYSPAVVTGKPIVSIHEYCFLIIFNLPIVNL